MSLPGPYRGACCRDMTAILACMMPQGCDTPAHPSTTPPDDLTDAGGYVGHGEVHPEMLDAATEAVREAVLDVVEDRVITLLCPEDYYDMLMLVGAPSRFAIRKVYSRTLDAVCATSSTQRLSHIAGHYVGKDDPVLAVRCQSGLPAVGEVLEPFTFPFAVAGWMRGSHHGPLMPCAVGDATPSAFDGPPRVVALGFQIHGGRLVGPRDMFADVAFTAPAAWRWRPPSTCVAMARSSRIACRWTSWSTRRCRGS